MLSKLFEKIILLQLKKHIYKINIQPQKQSEFIASHGCNTTLLDIIDVILKSNEQGQLTILAMLDFTKTFDRLLLAILHHISLSETAIKLFSYISHRSQMVAFENQETSSLPFISGVTQGSILGPILYSLHTFKLM